MQKEAVPEKRKKAEQKEKKDEPKVSSLDTIL